MYAVKRNFTFFERLFIWRRMNFSEQKFILMISFVVGVLTAFALSLIHISEPTRPY